MEMSKYLIWISCLRVGVTVVSVYPPNPRMLDKDLPRLENFLNNSGAQVAFTTLEYKRFYQLSSVTRKWPKGIKEWIATDQIVKGRQAPKSDLKDYEPQPDDIIFIQYTRDRLVNLKESPFIKLVLL